MKRRQRETWQWMARHRGILVRISAGFAAPDDRDDLVQEMMIALWHAIPRFRGEASAATFIYRVAQNTAPPALPASAPFPPAAWRLRGLTPRGPRYRTAVPS